jgi:hypothetical protein
MLEYDAEAQRTPRNRKDNALRILCALCGFAFQVMNSNVAMLEYDAETPRTQRNRKGLTLFLQLHHVQHDRWRASSLEMLTSK